MFYQYGPMGPNPVYTGFVSVMASLSVLQSRLRPKQGHHPLLDTNLLVEPCRYPGLRYMLGVGPGDNIGIPGPDPE
jgi:hypothetical protein